MSVSPAYRTQLNLLHDRDPTWGASARRWEGPVRAFANRLGARTILDYGCGKGMLKLGLKEFSIHEYDPGIKGLDADPPVCDLVAALDVIEHIEPSELGATLAHMADRARLGILGVIALYPSGTRLPDGRDAHLIVEPPGWWTERIERVWGPCGWELTARPTRIPRPEQVLVVRKEKR